MCGPSGLRESGSARDAARLAEQLAGLGIDRDLHDRHAAAPPAGPREVAGAVLVPEQIRIDAHDPGRVDGSRPGSGGVGGRDDQVTFAHPVDAGRDHPEPAVVVTDRRREDPAAPLRRPERQLVVAIEHVADELPRDEVAAVEDRHPGQVLERRVDQVVVVADPADRRVRVEPGDDRCGAHVIPSRWGRLLSPGWRNPSRPRAGRSPGRAAS